MYLLHVYLAWMNKEVILAVNVSWWEKWGTYTHLLMTIQLLSFANNEQEIINQNYYRKNLLGQHINKNKSKELVESLLGLLKKSKVKDFGHHSLTMCRRVSSTAQG